MKNRIAEYLPTPEIQGLPSQAVLPEIPEWARAKFALRTSQVATQIQEHPVMAISTAFCIGIFLGWVIKRR